MEFKSRNILLIAYYWPPAIGPGVQRVKEMYRYFSEQNFNVTVLSSHHDQSKPKMIRDENIIRVFDPIPETTSKGTSFYNPNSLISKLKAFIRGNFMIPDSKKFWAKNCKQFLNSYLHENEFDVCIASGPPQSIYLIAEHVKKNSNIYTVFDMRDPWSDAFFLKDFYRTSWAQNKDRRLEHKTLMNADMILARGIYQKSDILKIVGNNIPVKTIYNGFVDTIPNHNPKPIKTIYYTGVIAKSQIPFQLLKLLPKLNLKLRLFGQAHPDMIAFIDDNELREVVELNDPVSHDEIIKIQQNADLLLLLLPDYEKSEEIIPAKIFEYLASNRPILAFGEKTSECRHILYRSGIGEMFDFNEDGLEAKLRSFIESEKMIHTTYVNRYHRDYQFGRLLRYLKSV